MDYCSAGEYTLDEAGPIPGTMAINHQSRLVRWHAVRIKDGKPEDRAVDGFRYASDKLAADHDWAQSLQMRCLMCAEELGVELTGLER